MRVKLGNQERSAPQPGESERSTSVAVIGGTARHMYVVHMKRVTASDARKDWFRLLDEVAAGAVVTIERGGTTILLQRAPQPKGREALPDYAGLISAPKVEDADRWGWEWGPEGDLEPSDGAAP